MAYNKQNFEDGSILYAKQLNQIENGIVENENKIEANTKAVELNKTNIANQEKQIEANTKAVEELERDGIGVKDVVSYYLASASESGITVLSSGWTTTLQSTTSTKKYLWNYLSFIFTNGTIQNTTPCIISKYSVGESESTKQIQSDWNQNETTEKDYIKNRTHWKEEIIAGGEIVPETQLTFKTSMAALNGAGSNNIIENVDYTVVWNGTSYSLTAYTYSGSVCLGNEKLVGGTKDTEEPFCIEVTSASGSIVTKNTSAAETISIKIEAEEKINWHTIDPRYIKDMYYTEVPDGAVENIIVPSNTYTVDSDENMFLISDFTSEMQAGSTYTVSWNGVEYECVATDLSSTVGEDIIAIGSYQRLFDEENYEYPFAIIQGYDEETSRLMMACYCVDSITQVTLSITGLENSKVVHKIPNKYLDVDWLPTKKEQIYIKENTVNNQSSSTNLTANDINESDTIIIYCDEKRYELNPDNAENSYYAGNYSLISDQLPNTGEPILLMITTTKTYFYFKDSEKHIVSVGKYSYNKLPSQYAQDMITEIDNVTSNNDISIAYEALKQGKKVRCGNNSILYSSVSDGDTSKIVFISNNGLVYYDAAYQNYTASNGLMVAPMCPTNVQLGHHLEVAFNNGNVIGLKAVDPWVITSSTPGSTKKFKITVDDTGTISATEIS